jgi:hypothetical protein
LRGRLEAERRRAERVELPQTPAPAQETRKPAPRAPETPAQGLGTDAAGEALSGKPRRGGGAAGAASELKEVVGEMSVADKTSRLAWIVLQTANRTQAKGSSVRLVVPRAPEVTDELEPPLRDAELLEVEEYLLERGHVAPDDIGLTWGTYTIKPAGFYFLEGGLPEPKDSLRELANNPGEEAALESAIQAELAEEHRLMEEVERELEEVSQKLPGGASEEPERAESGSGGRGPQEGAERPWWRKVIGADDSASHCSGRYAKCRWKRRDLRHREYHAQQLFGKAENRA